MPLDVRLRKVRDWLQRPCLERLDALGGRLTQPPPSHVQAVGKAEQLLLAMEYRRLLAQALPLPPLADVGFSNFSQFDEDGQLLYLFTLIGAGQRKCVEICAGVGSESMSANLIVNHNWQALLVDGALENVLAAKAFFGSRRETAWQPPKVAQSWVAKGNVNETVRSHGFEGEIDLLALDMDGVEFHIWESLTAVTPRVLVTEINDLWPADVCVTVRYRDDFRYSEERRGYCGASLGAWVKSCRQRGYRLVGCNRNALNCYFVRNDQAPELLPEVEAAACLSGMATREKQARHRALIEGHDWVAV